MNLLPLTKKCKCVEDIDPLLKLLSEWIANMGRYPKDHEDTSCFHITWKINSLVIELLEHRKDHQKETNNEKLRPTDLG